MVSDSSSTSEERNQRIRRLTYVGLAANVVLTLLKVGIGILGGSKSLLADGVHSLSDAASDICVLVGITLWAKPQDDSHPYGHGKFESMTSLVISLFLLGTALGIIWDSVASFGHPHEEVPGLSALVIAVISILVKEFFFRWSIIVGEELHSESVIANAWHHRSDALSSVVAAISIGVSHYYPGHSYVDGIGAIMVSVILLQAAVTTALPALRKLSDAAPDPDMRKQVAEVAAGVEGVCDAHAMRMRYIGADIYVDMHIEVDPMLSVAQGHDIATHVSHALKENFVEVADVVVHVEPLGRHEME